MSEKSRRDRVGLGLIGLGPGWELLYCETLVRLQKRLTIRQVYDPVEARAKSVASEFDAEVAGSLRQMLSRPTLQGLLVLDLGWLGAGALSLIARCGKPVYLAGPVLRQVAALRATLRCPPSPASLGRQQSDENDQLMPELGLRFTPSTCRLRELMATKLGTVQRILIECNLSANTGNIAQLVDWCIHMMGQSPHHLASVYEETSTQKQINFEFPSSPSTSNPRVATLKQSAEIDGNIRFTIECERGEATLVDRTRIQWRNSAETADEFLEDERDEIEILIDQFCRRAVGGLNPVGRLSEFLRAIEIVESISQ